MKKILILNGSIHGDQGNCQILIKRILKFLKAKGSVEVVHLSEHFKSSQKAALTKKISSSDGLIFVSGTYWDSWGSPLQQCLEEMTELEGTPAVLGKSSAVFILEHSVGGKGVLSRLQGVLSTFGLLIPPMSGMVYSSLAQAAATKAKSKNEDYWSLEDIETVLENFWLGLEMTKSWKAWPVDRKNFRRRWVR